MPPVKLPPVRKGLGSGGLNNGDVIYGLAGENPRCKCSGQCDDFVSTARFDACNCAVSHTNIGKDAISRATLSDLRKDFPYSKRRSTGFRLLKFEKDYSFRGS